MSSLSIKKVYHIKEKRMTIEYATISETGRRANNEDAFRVIDMPEKKRWMGIVCDGMGGHDMGEVASETVINAISDCWKRLSDAHDNEEKIAKACQEASAAIDERASALHHCQMGTTMVMASIEGDKVMMAHVGDSRCYLIRPGHYDYDDISNSEKDHVVYQTKDHVGLECGWEVVEKCFFSYWPQIAVPETARFEIEPGDRILLCSDGVYKCIPPNMLKDHLTDDKSPEEILKEIALLCQKNGNDNYTAILARVYES